MRNTSIILVLLLVAGCSQKKMPTVLAGEYIFLMADGEMLKIGQSNDSLYTYDCYPGLACTEKFYYQILDVDTTGGLTVLKVKGLDSVDSADALCPAKPYSIIVMKRISNEQLEYRHPFHCLTKNEADTFEANSPLVEAGRFSTYYSDSYLEKLSYFKRPSSTEDIRKIINAIKGNDFNSGKISYTAEELTRACIENRYNPIGAGIVIDSFLKKNFPTGWVVANRNNK